MERGSRYGTPVERKPDGALYETTPEQQGKAARLIQQNCCNYEKGNCVMLEDEDERVCLQQRISYSVGCRWFRNAVLPLSPELIIILKAALNLKGDVLFIYRKDSLQ